MKKAIVLGASSGIGNALAKILADNNYYVGITGRNQNNLNALKETNPDHFLISNFDCTISNNKDKLNELVQTLDGLDLLVFSTGIGELNEALDAKIENETNHLNVLAFTEVVCWTTNYFLTKKRGI
ncbi:SDR family NAD(P)-dependent oxidoreductase [Aquimarina agarivorans]|uniref:SDR family NAD(P)-dependent oxidoreductase n=1 Tax=Aquimarina agarivorans TaxID=980584 RepID=UPI000248EA70|nr:SDR family NAD(P)-dependent oxidoreductase [Aquimarina agarivorans]